MARAYETIGEFEGAVSLTRDVAARSFLAESRLAAAWEAGGDLERAVRLLRGLSVEYPGLSVVEAADLGLVHRVLEDEADRPPGREALGVSLAEAFLRDHPASTTADEATLALAAARLGSGEVDEALRWASAGQRRYPRSRLADTFRVIAGWALLSRGDARAAAATLLPVARRMADDPAAANRGSGDSRADASLASLAGYLMAQSNHAGGRVAEAIEGYRAVAEDFPEAAEAADELAQRSIACPEVTHAPPRGPAVLPVTVRNLQAVGVQTYDIDLFALQGRAAGGLDLGRVGLAGIQPIHVRNVPVPDPRSGTPRTLRVALPIVREGAYLVILEAGGARTSGLVLLSGISVEVLEPSTGGRVRVHVRHEPGGQPAAGATVRVSGAPGGRVVEGTTDARGLLVADGLTGTPTVLARLGASFDLAKGRGSHTPPAAEEWEAAPPAGGIQAILERARALGAPRATYLREVVLAGGKSRARE